MIISLSQKQILIVNYLLSKVVEAVYKQQQQGATTLLDGK